MLETLATVTLLLAADPTQQPPPQAQPRCRPHQELKEGLRKQYGEVLAMVGIVEGGKQLVEIYASGETKTWSAVLVLQNGQACMVSSGKGWIMEMPPPGTPA